MNADEIRQRKKKRRGQKDMISIETLGQRTKFIADDKYKLIEDNETDSEDEEVLQHNGKVPNSNLTATSQDEIGEITDDDTARLINSSHGNIIFSGFGDKPPDPGEAESFCSITVQILFPFIVAGLGMVGAGLVLDIVQHWTVFETVNEIFILVPALLGLKGNLEMTLASRLSTQANLGNLDKKDDCMSMVTSNLALVQCQGIVVGFVASIVAVIMDFMKGGELDLDHTLLLCASAIVTASIASFLLGLVMVGVIVLSRRCKVNPDNVATPIAASLGDLITLAMLASITSFLFHYTETRDRWPTLIIITLYILFTPICIYFAKKNQVTQLVLYTGWTPVLIAMTISSLGGLILDSAVNKFNGIAVFQPVFNGVGGNLVAVQASRISTYLHSNAAFGELPSGEDKVCLDPLSVIIGESVHSRTCRILMMLVVPGHLLFAFTISFFNLGHTTVTPIFVIFYICAAFLQIWILLHTAHWMIHLMWKWSIDPDNSAIPYLTALGDLLGGGLLALAFEILFLIGDKDSDVGD